MTLDPTVLPGLLLLAAQLLALSTVGYIVARVALRQRDNRLALAQGLAIGPALWGLTVNFVLYALPGQAGAVAAWGIVLALGAGLAWRAPFQIRLPLHTAAGFAVATLVVFWAVLACRQLVSIVDAYLQLGLAASIRAGSFPPVFPWQPGEHAPYHYGVNLLVALLAPPFGPDPAFTTELIDTLVWTTFAMVLAATVLRYGSWLAVAVSCPLLLSLGLWTQVHYTAPPGIVEILLPAGIPSAGIRHSLAEVYWPSASTSWTTALEVSPPNIVKPSFALAYALALVVLEHASAKRRRHPAAHLALAFVVGFLGLVDEVIAVTVLALWMSMECLRLLRDWRRGGFKRNGDSAGYLRWKRVLGSFMGPSLATALLVVGGGLITSILTGSSPSGVSLAWIADAGSRRPIADLAVLTGGVGVLAVGTIPVAAAAIAIGRRDSLVMLLAIASAVLLLAAFTLRYEFSTSDIARLDGHARNFALAALLVGLGIRLPDLRPRWRYTVAAFTIAAVTWPTAIGPVQNVRAAISRGGVEFKNAQLIASGAPGRESSRQSSRHRMPDSMAPGIAAYVREQTPLDTRILSPSPSQMSILTGRANAAGFLGTVQFHPTQGPEYRDAIRFLEPLALWKLGIDFIHAPDAWVGGLPHRAQQWLQNPELFEPLISEDAETLFRVLPAFYDLKSTPQPESFEALRRSVPTASTVYFSAVLEPAEAIRVATVLAHTRLLGRQLRPYWHSRLEIEMDPLGSHTPDLVVTPLHRAPSAFPPGARWPVWWNKSLAIYAPANAIRPIMSPPSRSFTVQLTESEVAAGRIAFDATFTNMAPEQWTGQDWLVISADSSPWAIPRKAGPTQTAHEGSAWFAGQAIPGIESLTQSFEFDARKGTLAVERDGRFEQVQTSGQRLQPGTHTLAVRLQRANREVALIPVMEFSITSSGKVSYRTYEGQLGAPLRA